jgi:hypothetical protein
LIYSSLLGGLRQDQIAQCSTDSLGRFYMLGYSTSPDFPISDNSLFPNATGCGSFIAIFDPSVSAITYSTFLTDAPRNNWPMQMAITGPGVVWVSLGCACGMLVSDSALQRDCFEGPGNVSSYFMHADLNRGVILYASYLGRPDYYEDQIRQIIPGDSNRIWLFGNAGSEDFPMPAGGYDPGPPGFTSDFFALELQLPNTLLRGTFVGGPEVDVPWIAWIDPSKSVIIFGNASDGGFPTTPDAIDRNYHPSGDPSEEGDLALCKLSPDLTTLEYSTYMGGNFRDWTTGGIYFDDSHTLWLAGNSNSNNFYPITDDAMFHTPAGSVLIRMDFSPESTAVEPTVQIPKEFSLSCFPNPFNPTTTLSFSLPSSSPVRLEVFDVLGRVAYSMDFGRMSAGEHRQVLDASEWGSGVYFARVEAGERARVQKMVVVK